MEKKKNNRGKITLGMLKGKPITSSVPSIAFRFNATAGEIEELYVSDGEQAELIGDTFPTSTASDIEGSPSKSVLPKLTKRSTSIDVSPASIQDASPPSDPWRFFTDIKGKITKSVEGKITEYKTRTNEGDNSPKTSKPVKDGGKDSSSLSDSEELSESSISRTCGIVSTTEGVEMSSDDETPSLPETNLNTRLSEKFNVRRRFRVTKQDKQAKAQKVTKAGYVSSAFLENLHKINLGVETQEQKLEIDTGVDALEQLQSEIDNIDVDDEDIINIRKIDGIDIRNDFYARNKDMQSETCIFAPDGYVDLRPVESEITWRTAAYSFRVHILSLVGFILYFTLPLDIYMYGFIAGNLCMFTLCYGYYMIFGKHQREVSDNLYEFAPPELIEEIPAIKEHTPLIKYEGWVNEYPEKYDPFTYHISKTQSVYLRLQGNLLKISHTRSKVPKKAVWNEGTIKQDFTRHRIYNLLGAKIKLLPDGLTKIRHWSKKYPICITLSHDQINYDYPVKKKSDKKRRDKEDDKSTNDEKELKESKKTSNMKTNAPPQVFSKLQDEENDNDNLCKAEIAKAAENAKSSEIRTSDQSIDMNDMTSILSDITAGMDDDGTDIITDALDDIISLSIRDDEDAISFMSEDWQAIEENENETSVYLFGRTGREKEHWYRRLTAATHLGAKGSGTEIPMSLSDTLKSNNVLYEEYLKFMSRFHQVRAYSQLVKRYNLTPKINKSKKGAEKKLNDAFPPKGSDVTLSKLSTTSAIDGMNDSRNNILENPFPTMPPLNPGDEEIVEVEFDTLWINSIMNRIMFDLIRNASLLNQIKERIQRKLSSVKLPYFIEELTLVELSLGSTPPLLTKTGKPTLDDRGLWVDVDINYDGHFIITLQTKLNLLKLKHANHTNVADTGPDGTKVRVERSPIYHSDVDDTAESSTDDDAAYVAASAIQLPLDSSGYPVPAIGGTSTKSKKIFKMVDRIAESKFFQAATENKYIKRAIEGVSNTDLSLKIELRSLAGTLVVNIPEPPTDRIWVGFRPIPKMNLTAQPIVGERNISFLHVSTWIEKKIYKEFQKILVIPNMEDLQIPVMSDLLPE